MLRDRFGAKNPKTRDSRTRSLVFDIEKVKDHLKNYVKESSTKISCYRKVNESSDSSDSNRKDLFNSFFSIEPSLEIHEEGINQNIIDINHMEEENSHNENKETTTQGSPSTVTAVTAVTNENQSCNQLLSNPEIVYKKQEQNIATEFIEKDNTNYSNSSVYQYTPQQIEKFFASDNGQVEEHSFEDSICRPLIGKQIHKPFFHYCKICPKVENINLISIEHHIEVKISNVIKQN